MKYLLHALGIAWALLGVAYAQKESTVELSNTEKFSSKSGSLYQRSFVDVDAFNGMSLKVLKITDLITGQSSTGLRMESKPYYSASSSSRTASVTIDPDEIEALIKSIRVVQEKILPSSPGNYTEVIFKSRAGFETGCYWDNEKAQWKAYFTVKRYDDDYFHPFPVADLPKLLSLLENAKSKL